MMRILILIFCLLFTSLYGQDHVIELCEKNNKSFIYSAVGSPNCQWSWKVYFSGSIVSVSNDENVLIDFEKPGNYLIEAQIENELCESEIQQYSISVIECRVSALYFPNAFTPNRDGINDIYKPVGSYIDDYELSIYDRWGQIIFTTRDLLQGWDGGQSPIGIYTYDAVYKDIHGNLYIKTGSITLYR
jgi:gliding motility-associated-like protein